MLIPGGACVLALVALSLDVLDGEGAIRNTLSHVCGQFDVILKRDVGGGRKSKNQSN